MSKMKKIIMVVMILFVSCLLMAMTFEVKATNDGNPIIDISGNIDITTGNETTEPDLNTTANETANTEGNGQIIQPNTNTTENVTEELPKTGITEDITVMFFIVVFIVLAIYAYKKIRDYNM